MKALEAQRYYSYDDLVASMDVEVVHEGHEQNYQGDSHYIVREDGRCGYMTFGWGSCGGCDALQACMDYGSDESTLRSVTELRDEIYNQIHWEETPAKLFAYMADKDWRLDWRYHAQDFRVFLAEALTKLSDVARAEVK
ncbi:hypothetical protein GCM10010149_88930 [Nonomuraea roseoviolacea subsp. roseoviolacea]|uniref:hypothetical protein n=1 Tax=Nonomuraea roseoviolacea TaxID=103837 RepID=UPI0031E3F79A